MSSVALTFSAPFSLVLCAFLFVFSFFFGIVRKAKLRIARQYQGALLSQNGYGLSSALKDDTYEPKKRKETRTKPTKMARKKSTLRMTRTTTDILPTSTFLPAFTTRIQQGRDCRREGAKEWKRRVLAQLLRVRSSHWHVARSTTKQRTIYGSPQTDPAQSAQL